MPATLPAPTATLAPPGGPRCLFCDGADLRPCYRGVRDRLGHVPGEREFWRCESCRSLALVPQPRADELADFYPPVYSFTPGIGGGSRLKGMLAKLEHRLFFGPQYRAQVNAVVRATGCRSGAVLDIGCGRGALLMEFRRRGFTVHGFDLLPAVVKQLNDELDIPAVCGDVSELSSAFPAATFDLVTAFYLVEHIPDVRQLFADAFGLLKPGGWFAAAVPLGDSIQGRLFGKRWTNVTEAPRHLSVPNRAGMRLAFTQAGFVDVRIEPDSLLNCAGQVGTSAVPGATLTHAYGKRSLLPLVARGVGAVVTLAALPFVFAEGRILGRPPLGIVCGRKPRHSLAATDEPRPQGSGPRQPATDEPRPQGSGPRQPATDEPRPQGSGPR